MVPANDEATSARSTEAGEDVGVKLSGDDVVEWSHQFVSAAAGPGATVVDATVGNGKDTVFLARLVAPNGVVHGFDIQEPALAATRGQLVAAKIGGSCELHHAGHESTAEILRAAGIQSIRAAMFNLGYLPGGEKSIITRPDSTLRALAGLLDFLAPGGVITVVVYAGHPGGGEESVAVMEWARRLPREFRVTRHAIINRPESAPILIAIERR